MIIIADSNIFMSALIKTTHSQRVWAFLYFGRENDSQHL